MLTGFCMTLDKVAGALAHSHTSAARAILVMSSRLSIEIVHEAAAIGSLEGSGSDVPRHAHPLHSTIEGAHCARSWRWSVARGSIVDRGSEIQGVTKKAAHRPNEVVRRQTDNDLEFAEPKYAPHGAHIRQRSFATTARPPPSQGLRRVSQLYYHLALPVWRASSVRHIRVMPVV